MRSHFSGSGLARSRWAAVGAAVAVSLGAGGVALLHAAVDSSSAVFHALSPVRVFDTRDGSGGVPIAPIGPASALDVVVAGVNGVPADATAVVLNVTVVDGTASSFLTVWPTGDPKPLASSLNWTGPAATPNGVTAPVGAGGKVSFYNLTGTVNVLADVTGYYTAAADAAAAVEQCRRPDGRRGPPRGVQPAGEDRIGQPDVARCVPGSRFVVGDGQCGRYLSHRRGSD